MSAIRAEALHQRLAAVEHTDHLAQRDACGRPRQPQAAAGAAAGTHGACFGQVAYNLGQVMARDAELAGDLAVVSARSGVRPTASARAARNR